MKRVLIDQGLSPRAAELLRQADWEALHVIEVRFDRADDAEILEFAGREIGRALPWTTISTHTWR